SLRNPIEEVIDSPDPGTGNVDHHKRLANQSSTRIEIERHRRSCHRRCGDLNAARFREPGDPSPYVLPAKYLRAGSPVRVVDKRNIVSRSTDGYTVLAEPELIVLDLAVASTRNSNSIVHAAEKVHHVVAVDCEIRADVEIDHRALDMTVVIVDPVIPDSYCVCGGHIRWQSILPQSGLRRRNSCLPVSAPVSLSDHSTDGAVCRFHPNSKTCGRALVQLKYVVLYCDSGDLNGPAYPLYFYVQSIRTVRRERACNVRAVVNATAGYRRAGRIADMHAVSTGRIDQAPGDQAPGIGGFSERHRDALELPVPHDHARNGQVLGLDRPDSKERGAAGLVLVKGSIENKIADGHVGRKQTRT